MAISRREPSYRLRLSACSAQCTHAPELFDLDDFDSDLAGAWLIGCQARTVIDQHSQRAQAIVTRASMIVAREIDPNGPLSLIGEVEARDPERARRTLGAFGNGLTCIRAL